MRTILKVHVYRSWLARAFILLAATWLSVCAHADISMFPGYPTLFQNDTTKLAINFATCPGCEPRSQASWSLFTSQPTAAWLSDWNTQGPNQIRAFVANYVGRAIARHQVPVLVAYMIPSRDCGSASAGGAPTAAAYRNWIDQFALGLHDAYSGSDGDETVIVLLEPDALALLGRDTFTNAASGDNGCREYTLMYPPPLGKSLTSAPYVDMDVTGPNGRYALVKEAVAKLSSAACIPTYGVPQPSACSSYMSHIKVYLDAGHSGWKGWGVADMATRLIKGGIKDATGFFSNVSNYQVLGAVGGAPTSGEIPYGVALINELKKQFGGTWGTYSCYNPGTGGKCDIPPKTQVIDTGRNGAGSNVAGGSGNQSNGWPLWCDNINARYGLAPTLYPSQFGFGTNTIDALLWVKPPGETDGCFWGGNTDPNVARGVPNPSPGVTGVIPAGALDFTAVCMLINGTNGFSSYGNPVLVGTCNLDGTSALTPPILNQAHQTRVADVQGADTLLLEWQPVKGACQYMVGYRKRAYGSTKWSGWSSIYSTAWAGAGSNNDSLSFANGPPTWALLTAAAGTLKYGATVQYSVRARNCGSPTSTAWTSYGAPSATISTVSFN